jgi:hypothetical protein
MYKRIEIMATINVDNPNVPLSKIVNAVIGYGILCCGLYIIFLLVMKVAGLLHVTELRFVNYVILCLVGMFEIRRWIKTRQSFVPFLQVIGTVFFTGVLSFFLFSIFLLIYSKFNTELAELFVEHTQGYFQSMPSVVIFFEGSAASIIVAFINMQYYRRYEEGEKSPKI